MKTERLQVRARQARRKITKLFTVFSNDELIEDKQIDCLRIVNKLICEPNTILRYIFDKKKYTVETSKYYVQIFDKFIILQNGKFSYHVDLPEKSIDEVKSLFNRVIERRDKISQQKYNDRTAKNLKEVLAELNS
jgi:hypothetical protein